MKRVIEIRTILSCSTCPHLKVVIKEVPIKSCDHPKQLSKDRINNVNVIPYWCPLEDV